MRPTEHMIQDTTLQRLSALIRDLTKSDEPMVGADLITELEKCCDGLMAANHELRRKMAEGLTSDVSLPALAEYIEAIAPADMTVRLYDVDDTELKEFELIHTIIGDVWLAFVAGKPVLNFNHGQASGEVVSNVLGTNYWGVGSGATYKPQVILEGDIARLDIWGGDHDWYIIPLPDVRITVLSNDGKKQYITTTLTAHITKAHCNYGGGVWPSIIINEGAHIVPIYIEDETGEPLIDIKGLATVPYATEDDIVIPWGDRDVKVDYYQDITFYVVN